MSIDGLLYDKFADLFQGRVDAYGTAEGGCEWIEGWEQWGHGTYLERIEHHLLGQSPLGVYPLRDDGHVWWGCTDLDDGEDSLVPACNIATMLNTVGLNAWVERSRSKGFHVWSFAAEPIPAETMRHAFLAAHQRLEIPAKEVNPKQIGPTKKGLGNYVRLPYPGAYESGYAPNGRQQIIGTCDAMSDWPLGDFVTYAYAARAGRDTYEAIADRYDPPPPRHVVTFDGTDQTLADLERRLNPPARMAFRYGPRDGHDRSSSLVRLAHLSRESNLTPSEARKVVGDADARWGKFHDRPDGTEQIQRIVESAYERTH